MNKKIIGFLALFLLVSCNNQASDNILSEKEDSSALSTIQEQGYVMREKETYLEFYEADKSLSNSYEEHLLRIEELNSFLDEDTEDYEINYSLVKFDSVSAQDSLQGYPIFNAYNKNSSGAKYIEILSESTFAIKNVTLTASIWKNGDLENLTNNYYLGLEYLKDDTWVRGESLDVHNVKVGRLYEEEEPFSFDINEENIRNVRIAFDFENIANNLRFIVYNMTLSGDQKVITSNTGISSIKFTENEENIHIGETLSLNPTIISSNNLNLVEFSSSDRSIATVNELGQVKGLSSGECLIYAKNGDVKDQLTLNVIKEGQDYTKVIQNPQNFIGEIPEGFTSNFETYYNGSQLNFKEQGNMLSTPTYNNITGSTVLILNIKSSAAGEENIELSKNNIFAVQGLNEDDEVVEEKELTNWANTSFEDVEFTFEEASIVRYIIYFKLKYVQDMGSYIKTGKNIVLNSLTIYQK